MGGLKRFRFAVSLCAACAALYGLGPETRADPPAYCLELLETYAGDSFAAATTINNQRQIAGYSHVPGEPYHVWVWEAGELLDLGDLGGNTTQSRCINESGDVVGYGNNEELDWEALVWINGEFVEFPTFGGPGTRAFGINESRQVVGDSQIPLPLGYWHAYIWEDGVMTDLGTLGGANSQAYAINNLGQVAGFAVNPAIQARAVIWEDHVPTELEHHPTYPNGVAYDINDAAVAVGTVGQGEEVVIPVKWEAGELSYLGQLTGDLNAYAWSINESGVVVGWTRPSFFDVIATIWIDGEVYDLNELIPPNSGMSLKYAWNINDNGEIAGMCHQYGMPRAYLLTPVDPHGGDYDADCDVDGDDFAHLPDCTQGPGMPPLGAGCGAFDFDEDLDADLADCAMFQRAFGA